MGSRKEIAVAGEEQQITARIFICTRDRVFDISRELHAYDRGITSMMKLQLQGLSSEGRGDR